MFDVTNRQSLINLQHWLNEVERFAPADVVTVIVGNKNDLTGQRQIETNEALSFATSFNLPYFETSATNHQSVCSIFDHVVSGVITQFPNGYVPHQLVVNNYAQQTTCIC